MKNTLLLALSLYSFQAMAQSREELIAKQVAENAAYAASLEAAHAANRAAFEKMKAQKVQEGLHVIAEDNKQSAEREAAAEARNEIARLANEAKAEEAAKRTAEIERRAADPLWRRGVYSARLCIAESQKQAALGQIGEQKRMAKIGGVINKAVIYQLQESYRSAETDAEVAKSNLRDLKAKPFSCHDQKLAMRMSCNVEDPDPAAQNECSIWRDLLESAN